MHELPSKKELESRIFYLNSQMALFKVRITGFKNHQLPFEAHIFEDIAMSESTSTADFWKYFIGEQVNAIVVMLHNSQMDPGRYPINKDLIKKTQWQCFSRTSNWMNAKKDINTPSENQSCEAFLKICELVDWEEVPPAFFEELNNIVKETGNVYMMMEGNLPLSKILENLRES